MASVMWRGIRETLTKENFHEFIMPIPFSGCWIWPGSSGMGYGKIEGIGAHRWAYKTFVGEIPQGKFVCHACDVVGCVNPSHLFLAENGENFSDMHKKKRGHYAVRDSCKHGHPFSEINTYLYKNARMCRACNAIAAKRYKGKAS